VAVGILVERLRMNRHDAFETLRDNARCRRRGLLEVAEQIVSAAEVLNEISEAGSRARRKGV
jgi:two-component system, response regulator PdtaR